jgi:hypothetical protein
MAYPSPRLVALPPRRRAAQKKADAERGGVRNPARRPALGASSGMPRTRFPSWKDGPFGQPVARRRRSAGGEKRGASTCEHGHLAESRDRGNGRAPRLTFPCVSGPPILLSRAGAPIARRPLGRVEPTVPSGDREIGGTHAIPDPTSSPVATALLLLAVSARPALAGASRERTMDSSSRLSTGFAAARAENQRREREPRDQWSRRRLETSPSAAWWGRTSPSQHALGLVRRRPGWQGDHHRIRSGSGQVNGTLTMGAIGCGRHLLLHCRATSTSRPPSAWAR